MRAPVWAPNPRIVAGEDAWRSAPKDQGLVGTKKEKKADQERMEARIRRRRGDTASTRAKYLSRSNLTGVGDRMNVLGKEVAQRLARICILSDKR
jgi:hypothetical protein